MPAGPEPEADPRDQVPLFIDRHVTEEKERDDRIERGLCDEQLGRVSMDEARLRHVVTRQLDLHRGNVDPRDAMTAGELAGRWYATTATELEHVGAVG